MDEIPVKKKRNRSCKSYKPTDNDRALVNALISHGVPVDEVAAYLGVARRTVQNHFKEELTRGKINANLRVSKKLFDAAMDGNTTAQIFWLKARAGWSDRSQVELSGPEGTPLAPPKIVVNFVKPHGDDNGS